MHQDLQAVQKDYGDNVIVVWKPEGLDYYITSSSLAPVVTAQVLTDLVSWMEALQGRVRAEEEMTEEEWDERQVARGELAGAPDTMECYECLGFDGIHFIMQKVVKLGPIVEAHRDPTQTYILECGHTTI